MTSPTIVNVGYRSTNYWVVGGSHGSVLVDIGWPGSMGTLQAALRAKDIGWPALRYALATHYHMDHAGLGEEIKQHGVRLWVLDVQVDAIDAMRQWMKPDDHYVPITAHGNHVTRCDEGRALLATLGIAGQVVHTPGHSDHCVSLLLDDGSVFTGDLTHAAMLGDDSTARDSWRRLYDLGARRVHPGHGPVYPLRPPAAAPDATRA